MTARERPPDLNILAVLEFLGAELPAHIKAHGWTPINCPIHHGFSASINPPLGKMYCFGCDWVDDSNNSGDSYDLLRVIEGIQLEEATQLAEERGWIVGADARGRGAPRKPREGARKPPERRQRREAARRA